MDAEDYRHLVAALFPCASVRGRRTAAVAVEHELLTADAATGAAVPVDRVRAAVDGASYAPYVGFEPGGQVELSWPCAPDVPTLARRVRADLAALRAGCLEAGIRLESSPVDVRPESEVPLQLDSPRYVAMQRHFDTIGPAGRRMMRRTASTQVCLDWWAGGAGLEQWRLLNLAGPFLAAAFARPGSDRLLTWLAVDPSRTAFDGRLLRGDDPVSAYADFAAAATPIVGRRGAAPDDALPARPTARPLPRGALPRRAGGRRHRRPRGRPRRARARRRHPQGGAAPAGRGRAPAGAALGRRGARWRGRRRPRPRARRPGAATAGASGMSGVLFVTDPLAGLQRRHRRQHRADGGHPGPRRRRLGLRAGGPRRRRRPGDGPRPPDPAGAAPPRRRPPLGRRLPVARAGRGCGRSTWPPTSR